jgi:hypothetical protein
MIRPWSRRDTIDRIVRSAAVRPRASKRLILASPPLGVWRRGGRPTDAEPEELRRWCDRLPERLELRDEGLLNLLDVGAADPDKPVELMDAARDRSCAAAGSPITSLGGPPMRQLMARDKVNSERVEENEELVRAVSDELRRAEPTGLRYATFKLDDGVSFIHLALTESESRGRPDSTSSGRAMDFQPPTYLY